MTMVSNKQRWREQQLLVSLVILSGAIAGGDVSLAQNVTLDGTLGPARPLAGPNYNILQSDGQTVGGNLFHSFDKFNLNAGESANFYSDPSIRNILARVTGGQSLINGLLQTVSGNVNLFLINPRGIAFGPNAQLNVGDAARGSFVATTVEALVWPNGKQFSATNPGGPDSLLTIVGDPSGFLAALRPPQAIAISGSNLSAYDGQSLLFLGGNVQLDNASLLASGGRVELGGLAGVGTVGLNVSGNNLRLSYPAGVPRADVSLTNQAVVDVTAGGGGDLAINARNVDILQGSILRAGIKPLSGSADAQAGDVTLNATGTINIDNGVIYNAAFGAGNGGNLSIDTTQLNVKDGVVATATFSRGHAGNLSVNASGAVNLTSTSASSTVSLNIPVDIPFGPFIIPVNFPIAVPTGLFAASLAINDFIDLNNPSISLFADLLPQSGGNAGNLTINTGRLLVQNGATVSASTTSQGRGGNLTVNASDIELIGTSPTSNSGGNLTVDTAVPSALRNETRGFGPAGDLTINTGNLVVRDGAWVTAGTAGDKPGGNLTVNAGDVTLSGTSASGIPSILATGTQGNGASRDLTINTQRLVIQDGAVVSAGTASRGQGGNLIINASESVELIGTAALPVSDTAFANVIGNPGFKLFNIVAGRPFPSGLISGTAGDGTAGDLRINTGRLAIAAGAQASVSTTTGKGNAGSLTVRAASVELTGTSKAANPNALVGPSLLTTAVSKEASGNGGDLNIETQQLTIRDGAEVAASTLGQGNGGDIRVQANSLTLINGARLTANTSGQGNAGNISVRQADAVNVSGPDSGLFTDTNSTGKGGDITVESRDVRISDGAVFDASTSSINNGGFITVNANILEAANGGQLRTTTFSGGRAGDITVNATEKVNLNGPASGLFANTALNSTGRGGDLSVVTGQLSIQNGAQVTASSQGTGDAGNIVNITARSLNLDNGSINTSSRSGQGGNIDRLQVQDLLLMRNHSQISTSAGTDQNGGGDGGNINISTQFIVAVPSEDSDIRANAYSGKGGNIQITAQGLLGIQFRPRDTPLSDITASSTLGVNGRVEINTPGIDPSHGLVALPAQPVVAQVAQECRTSGDQLGSKFTITGRGGLPPNTREALSADAVDVDWVTLEATRNEQVRGEELEQTNSSPLVEAQGWMINAKGEVVLTAAPNVTRHSPWQTSTSCVKTPSASEH